MAEEIVNKVAASGLVQIDLLDYKPANVMELDLKDQLWQGLAIKEKDFRAWIKENDWSIYANQDVCVFCSEDAVIPSWAFMLVLSALLPHTNKVVTAHPTDAGLLLWKQALSRIPDELVRDKRVVVKGCGDDAVPHELFAEFIRLFQEQTVSIMYGEPCSTVPVYKRPW